MMSERLEDAKRFFTHHEPATCGSQQEYINNGRRLAGRIDALERDNADLRASLHRPPARVIPKFASEAEAFFNNLRNDEGTQCAKHGVKLLDAFLALQRNYDDLVGKLYCTKQGQEVRDLIPDRREADRRGKRDE